MENFIWDMHCHFVPGVDDGASDIKEAMELIDLEYKEGVRNIIITPHYRRKMFMPDDNLVVKNFEKLKSKAAKKYKDLNLYLGCELHKHSDMMKLLETEQVWKKTMNGGNYLLLEFKDEDSISRIVKYANQAVRAGYKPILAHIERYVNMKGQEKKMEDLRHIGVQFQVNADAIIGLDGFWIKRRVRKWIKAGYISYVGSDGHNMTDRIPHMAKAAKIVKKLVGQDRMEHIMVRNPRRVAESVNDVSDFV